MPDKKATARSYKGFSIPCGFGRALLTESDSRQRAYEFPWTSREDLQGFVDRLKKALPKAGITQTRPWIWTADTSMGKALTPCGKDTGLELRLSYSPYKS